MKTHSVPCGPAVNESERKAIAQLKTRIISVPGDDEWWLLTNLAFSATHRLQSDEIDIVAIGPPGVRIIEVKHWTTAWVNRNPDLVEQEAERVIRKARKSARRYDVECEISRTWTECSWQPRLPPGSRGWRAESPVRGVSFHTFSTWRGAVGLDAPNVLSLQQVRELGRFLQPRNAVRPGWRVEATGRVHTSSTPDTSRRAVPSHLQHDARLPSGSGGASSLRPLGQRRPEGGGES